MRGAFPDQRFFDDFLANQVKNTGTKMVEMKVAASIPPKTPVPMEWRAPAPAPVAMMSGTTPSTNAKDVIRIGRKRRPAASMAASRSEERRVGKECRL